MRKLSLILLIFVVVSIFSMSACSSQTSELESLKAENERLKAELEAKEKTENTNATNQTEITSKNETAIMQNNPSSLDNVNQSPTVQNDISISSYESKRKEFADTIKQALNAPGLPEMCTDAYFNSKGELIIEVNAEWLVLDKELRKDMVYALTELLRKSKKSLNVEGFGQFFSDSGRPLESFYAN